MSGQLGQGQLGQGQLGQGQLGQGQGQSGQGQWGPQLWKIIHAIGYRAGKAPASIAIDESRELQWLIKHLEFVIPCVECRRHCITYRASTPGTDSKGAAKWFWKFHETVNARLKKTGVEFTDDLGKDTKLSVCWGTYLKDIETHILTGKLVRKDVIEFGRHLGLWLRFAT